MESMKLKIKITGPNVHDVGYRVFLLKYAMNLALPGLSTYNWEENDLTEVIVLVEGDEARIAAFRQMVEKNKPELAEVSKVTFEDYSGEVGRTSEVAMFCSFVQLDKAIPLLLKIQDNTSVTPQILDEIKSMREDVQPGYARQVREDIRAIKERLGMS
jgi:acylphosphatase